MVTLSSWTRARRGRVAMAVLRAVADGHPWVYILGVEKCSTNRATLRSLIGDGLVTMQRDESKSGMPHYAVTDRGRDVLAKEGKSHG